MPRPMKKTNEKAKDFKGSIKKLILELKQFRIIIIIAILLSALGSIFSLITPNKLSNLVDEISKGLIVNTDNITIISKEITNNLTNINIDNILKSNISNDTKKDIINKFSSIDTKDATSIILTLSELSDETLNIILPNIMVNNEKITSKDQIEYLKILSTINKDSNSNELYSKIELLPNSIKKIIEPTMNMNKIKNIALFLLFIYVLSALFTYVESILMINVSNKFAKKLRSNISIKINKLPLSYFDKNQAGDILSCVTNDVDTIAQNMNDSVPTLVSAVTLLIGSIIMMFITNWIMAITAITASLIGFAFMAIVLSKSQKYFNQRQKYLGKINGHIEEVYSGLNVVKAYNGQKEVDEKFDELNEKLYIANKKGQFLSGLMMPMMSFVGNFGYVAVCIVGALLTMNGNITFGVIVAFITYVRFFTSPLSQIGQAMTSLQSVGAASERVFGFVNEREMNSQDICTKVIDKSKVKGNIEFENVEFVYVGNEKPTIKNFSAKALPGQKIAIVGPTGAGKTTMVNLLMKFYEINKGNIKIDGISINDLTRENVHELFTMVLQDTWLFDASIKENIIYNRENISDDEVEKVCKIVGLDHFIKTLPHSYDYVISDNDSVSAGQRQLLTIARGMIKNSPFLILDEATSNVDTRTEELVQNAMDKLTKGKTSFIIAHRLSTIKNADLILVMKDGNIIEQGNHDELMKKNGFYYELYTSQFEL